MTDQLLIKRRQLLQASLAFVPPTMLASTSLGNTRRETPNERLAIGMIGLGSRGFNLLDALLREPDVQIAAICDVDSLHYRDRKWGLGTAYGREPARQKIDKHYGASQGVAVTSDFRDLCTRDDLDAIVIATPDHWHALCTMEALRQGKDVYCEKPVTHTFQEGQIVYHEVSKQNAVFQTGSQQRSEFVFQRAVELVRNGHLGKIQRIEVGLPPGYNRPQGDATIAKPPENLDYDFWTGPAPLLPYMRARHHRWWRGHRAYGGGVLMDWIGHHNDIAHSALDLDRSGPTRVEAVNWTFPKTSIYNTPEQYEIRCEYASGVTNSISSRHTLGTRLIGETGWVFVTRGRIDASDPQWIKPSFDVGAVRVSQSNNHIRNFLDCIKSRQNCIAPAEAAHRSITPGHLGYVSQALRRALQWDAQTETVIGDDEANQILQMSEYRSPWKSVTSS